MLNLKLTSAAVLALGCSVAFAGTMGPVCTPGNVTVPCENTGFDLGIQALYLKPVYDADLTFYNQQPNGNWQDYDPNWDWAFRLEGSYHFSTGNDITVNWLYFKDDNHIRVNFPQNFPNLLNIPQFNVNFEVKTNIVNLEFGQHVDFGEVKNIRFHAGAQYVHLKHNGSTPVLAGSGFIRPPGQTTPVPVTGSLTVSGASKFKGVGARTGIDLSYDVSQGFGVYGKAAAALLVGKGDHNQLAVFNLIGVPQLPGLSFGRHLEKHSLVPNLDAKLGATYNYAMGNGNLIIDGGYMWTNYFNAIFTNPGVESDFALHGPYLGIKYIGHA